MTCVKSPPAHSVESQAPDHLPLQRLWWVALIHAALILSGAAAGWVFGLAAGAGSVVLAVVASVNAAVFCALTADALFSRWAYRRR